MKNKKLLIFSYDFPPSNGGIARLTSEIANGALNKLDRVVVITRKIKNPQRRYNFNDNIEINYLPSKRGKTELAAIKFLSAIKNKNEYYLLCGLWHPEVILAKLAGFKNINVLSHGTELLHGNSIFRRKFWLPIYAKWILKKTNIIANSDFTARLSKRVAPNARVTVLPLSVNQNYFKPILNKENKKFILGTVSRILQFKGHDFVLRVIKDLPNEYREKLEWHIAGTGPYLSKLKEDVENLKLEKTVKFNGFVPDNELPIFYNSLDLFVLCTRQTLNSNQVEGFGLVFLEAQACGVPVIGTNIGGIPSAVKNNNGGWLIEQDNEKQLADQIKMLMDNSEILKEHGYKARSRVEQFCTWDIYCKQLFNILEKE